jgi:hypothetical protein
MIKQNKKKKHVWHCGVFNQKLTGPTANGAIRYSDVKNKKIKFLGMLRCTLLIRRAR